MQSHDCLDSTKSLYNKNEDILAKTSVKANFIFNIFVQLVTRKKGEKYDIKTISLRSIQKVIFLKNRTNYPEGSASIFPHNRIMGSRIFENIH